MTGKARALARWISILAHPFVMVALLVTAPGTRISPAGSAFRALLLVGLAVLGPLGILMMRQVRRGRWSDVDASDRSERPILFIVALAGLTAVAAWLTMRNPSSHLLRGVLVTAGCLLVAWALTRWVKLSLHVAFAALTATALAMLGSPAGWILIAVLPPLAWSRLALGRHRPLELVLGLLLGAATGAALVAL
jgi:membrane-associated phospholipid phosphatase